jgi:hypothetical protein
MPGHVEVDRIVSFPTLTAISKLLKKLPRKIILPGNLCTLIHLAGDHFVRD